jgi:hypothetical protein
MVLDTDVVVAALRGPIAERLAKAEGVKNWHGGIFHRTARARRPGSVRCR